MRLAIADPPYPPQFMVRRDLADGGARVTRRSRATRWYGEGPGAHRRADLHSEASRWDDLTEHRRLLENMLTLYDGFAIATTPDGLGAYHPLPIEARIMAWVRGNAIPGGQRLASRWESVIVVTPPTRMSRTTGPRVDDVLTQGIGQSGFIGAKPPTWTHWVLDALGYDPDEDTVDDLYPGSGAVTAAISEYGDGMLA